MQFRFFMPNPFSRWTLMIEWFKWGKLIAFVYRVGSGYLANYKTIWKS